MCVTLDAANTGEMAGNNMHVDAGWLTTRKAKKRKPLQQKNEGTVSKQAPATQDLQKEVCRYRI